ncbi:hypothetical protein Tco_0617563 [Tanacetum coccineum]
MDEILDCFILDGPLADLPEAAHLQPCLKQLSVPIHHSDDKAIVGETSLSFAFLNVHSRAEGAKKHVVALRQLMMEIVSNPCLLRLGCVKLELLRLLSPSRTLMRSRFTSKASSFFVGSTSIDPGELTWPILIGIKLRAVLLVKMVFLYYLILSLCSGTIGRVKVLISSLCFFHQFSFYSFPQTSVFSFNQSFVCGCFTEAKH